MSLEGISLSPSLYFSILSVCPPVHIRALALVNIFRLQYNFYMILRLSINFSGKLKMKILLLIVRLKKDTHTNSIIFEFIGKNRFGCIFILL